MQEDNELQFGTFWDKERFNGEIAFHNMRSEFQFAAAKYPTELHESFYIFAGHPVRLRVVGSELASHIGRPFSHLRTEQAGSAPPPLTIEIWDKNKMNGGYQALINRDELEWTEMTLHSADRRYVAQQLPHTSSCLDRDSRHIMASIAWHDQIFIYERAKPLARLLLEWHNDRDVQMIHTGMVARDNKGLLLVGKSGAGKSTTSLACAWGGLQYLSDDYVGLQCEPDGSFIGHSVYNSVFVNTHHLSRFEELFRHAIQGRPPQEEKSVIILSQLFPERLQRSAPIQVVGLVRVTREAKPQIRPATKGEALLALGPSSLLQIPNRGLGARGFETLTKLVDRVPCYWLEVGGDLQSITDQVNELLTRPHSSVRIRTEIHGAREQPQVIKPGSASGAVTQRRFPYPYKALLAISSDADAMSPWAFVKVHRFLNTLAPDIPHYGDGVGLDIGDSFFFKALSNKALSVYSACYRYRNEDAWADEFGGEEARELDSANARDPHTGKLIFQNGPTFIEKYIRAGWIDVLHGGDGSWAENCFKRGATDWCRTDGQHYMEWMKERDLRIDTFTNHSAVTSDFGVPNQPSTPDKPRSLGDLPSSPAYWADYAHQSGLKFYWSYIPNEAAAYRHTFGQDSMLVPATFRDDNRFWHFSRYDSRNPYADTIDRALDTVNLESLVRRNQFEIVYTHFGYWSDNTSHADPELPRPSMNAFRLLKIYQDKGKILVAKTSRLLRYNLALDHLAFTVNQVNGRTIIDIRAIEDSQFGDFIPTVTDLRGVTFYVSDSSKAEIRIRGARVPANEIQRNPPDETGKQSLGIKWFQPDYTDYTTWTLADVNQFFSC
jgi:hypothetical protein